MYRVLTEAEMFAPAAYHRHMDSMVSGYARSLRRSKFAHQLEGFDSEELETIATMLIGARTFLLMRYGVENNIVKTLPADKLESYLKFIGHGIIGQDRKSVVSGKSVSVRLDPGGRRIIK